MNIKRILIVAVILLFPVVFYLVLIKGKNQFKPLPFYGPKELSVSGDTVYHSIPPFSLINQYGKNITQADVREKIYVTNFFFARCPQVCPKMNENLREVAVKFKGNDKVQFLSITVDPMHDSLAVLKNYSDEREAQRLNWWFLTGFKDSIYNLAREGFLVSAAQGKTADDFFHSESLILIDHSGRIRSITDGMNQAEMKKLIGEIELLLYESKNKQ